MTNAGITVRGYLLKLYPNKRKAESIKYSFWWSEKILLDFVRRFWYKEREYFESTAGRGNQVNCWQKRARDALRGVRASNGHCPSKITPILDGTVRKSKHSSFDYWVKPIGLDWIPTKSHHGLNQALIKGGELQSNCEIINKCDEYFVRVFVAFSVPSVIAASSYLGCDVGVNAGVARSDGYIGKNLRSVLDKSRQKRAEQNRQGHHKSSTRSVVKQILDREAKRIVTLAKREGKTLVLESPKALANLKPFGKIGGWTRRHFDVRVRQIAEIAGVAIQDEWPAYTSITCLICGYSDKRNRRGTDFHCVRCGARGHADVVAARNLVRKARGDFFRVDKAALQTRTQGEFSWRNSPQ